MLGPLPTVDRPELAQGFAGPAVRTTQGGKGLEAAFSVGAFSFHDLGFGLGLRQFSDLLSVARTRSSTRSVTSAYRTRPGAFGDVRSPFTILAG